jgi:DNA-binding response OmpR family regulator
MPNDDITLMIAEDDDTIYVLTERYLRKSGINNRIIRFEDGEKLQAFIDCSNFREKLQDDLLKYILILDVRMPRKNGIEVLSYMKHNNLLDQIPAIMFSACPDPETKTECFNIGSRDFLEKPPGPDLIKSIKDIAMSFACAV